MKTIFFSIILIIFFISVSSRAQFYAGNDSLLFDGAMQTSVSFQSTAQPCLMKVLLVNGNVTGTVVKKEITTICGEPDTIITQVKKLLKEGDMVVAGQNISTEGDKDFIIAQTGQGENMILGGERGVVKVQDYCKNPPNIYMSMEAGKLGIDWNPVLPKTVTVCSDGACIRIKGTKFTLQIVNEGGVISNVLKVYEGTVAFSRNIQNEGNKTKVHSKEEQMKKLTDDYQSGKISLEEFMKKMQEINNVLSESLSTDEISVSAGYESRITGTDKPTDPVPMDVNEKPWWE